MKKNKQRNQFDPNKVPVVGDPVNKDYTPPSQEEPEIEVDVEPEIEVDVEPEIEVDVEPEIEVDVEPEIEVDVEPESVAYATVRKVVNVYARANAASGIVTSFSKQQKVLVTDRRDRWAFVVLKSDRTRRGYVLQAFLKFEK